MAFTVLKPSNVFCLLILLLVLHSPTSCKADDILPSGEDDNILYSGQTLHTGEYLRHGNNYWLLMQINCDLVLYDNDTMLWHSNTSGRGENCNCTLRDDGNLVILDELGRHIWDNKIHGEKGSYVLILQEKGILKIFGPDVWTVPRNITNVSDAAPAVAVVNNALGRKAKLTSPELLESVVDAVVN